MRSFFLLCVLALFSLPALATNVHAIEEGDDACTIFAKTAGVIMKARQAGVPMSNLLNAHAKIESSEEIRQLMRTIVIDAYDSPRFQTKEYQFNAEMDYRNNIHVACLRETEG